MLPLSLHFGPVFFFSLSLFFVRLITFIYVYLLTFDLFGLIFLTRSSSVLLLFPMFDLNRDFRVMLACSFYSSLTKIYLTSTINFQV